MGKKEMAKRRRKNYKNQPVVIEHKTSVGTPIPHRKKESKRSTLQTVEQERAKHALDAVQDWAEKDKSDQKELKSYVVGMPAMILMSGFGQTCAFYKSNKKENHELVLDALQNWLAKGDLMSFITQSSTQSYQLAQAESLAYLNWLKKFARAYLEGGDDDATAA